MVVTAEDEKLRDPEGYAAIRELHGLMDDDKSGTIDRAESADFLKVDMKVGGNDKAVRENAFHHKTDESVTVDDLWNSWFQASKIVFLQPSISVFSLRNVNGQLMRWSIGWLTS